MLRPGEVVEERPETRASAEPQRFTLLSRGFQYAREDLLRLYKESTCPAALETAPRELVCLPHAPVLSPTLPFSQPLGSDPCVRVHSRRQEASEPQVPSPERKPLRVVLNSSSRNVPPNLQLTGSHLVRETSQSRLNPDAQPWFGSGLDPRLPRYHVSILQEKVQRGDPFAIVLLQSGRVDSCGFLSQPPTSQALEKVWFYKDPQDVIQGPFTSVEMFNWTAAGYFSLDLLVALGGRTNFSPLAQYFRRPRADLKLVAEDV